MDILKTLKEIATDVSEATKSVLTWLEEAFMALLMFIASIVTLAAVLSTLIAIVNGSLLLALGSAMIALFGLSIVARHFENY